MVLIKNTIFQKNTKIYVRLISEKENCNYRRKKSVNQSETLKGNEVVFQKEEKREDSLCFLLTSPYKVFSRVIIFM